MRRQQEREEWKENVRTGLIQSTVAIRYLLWTDVSVKENQLCLNEHEKNVFTIFL